MSDDEHSKHGNGEGYAYDENFDEEQEYYDDCDDEGVIYEEQPSEHGFNLTKFMGSAVSSAASALGIGSDEDLTSAQIIAANNAAKNMQMDTELRSGYNLRGRDGAMRYSH